jgi:hypothetical protein
MKYLIHQKRDAGFFSTFNIIVGALMYLKQNNITNFYINWTNPLYQQQETNLFDTFFYQQNIEYFSHDSQHIDAVQIGNVYEPILQQQLFLKLNQILHHYNYFENTKYKECLDLCKKHVNSLGVHVRRTDHGQHSELLDIDNYFHIVDTKLSNLGYTKLFLTTDDLHVVSLFKKRYGDIVYRNENGMISSDGRAIHFSNHSNKEQLALDVMIDALSLTCCDEIIITSSNIAAYALMINPAIKYEQIDIHKNHY